MGSTQPGPDRSGQGAPSNSPQVVILPLRDAAAFIDRAYGRARTTDAPPPAPATDAPRLDVGEELEDIDPRDPRGTGTRGGYPQVNWGAYSKEVSLQLRNAHSKSAAARIVVDRIPADTWSRWGQFTGPEHLVKAVEDVCRNPTGQPGERPVWWWFERADRLASRDGVALLYPLLEDASGDAGKPPGNVRGIRALQVVTRAQILDWEVDFDPRSPTFGRVKTWRLAPGSKDNSVPRVVHGDRVIPFIPDPDEDDPWAGRSPLWTVINYVEWLENVNWSSAESYMRGAAPWIKAEIDPNVNASKEERDLLKKQLARLQNGNVQRIVAKGAKIELLHEPPTDPSPHWGIAISTFAMATGYPKRELTGDASGELAAAREDARRAARRISARQEQYAGPIMDAWIHRLESWGVETWQRPDRSRVEFTWSPLIDADAKEEALRQMQLGIARRQYRDTTTPLPLELEYEASKQFDALPPPPSRAPFDAPVVDEELATRGPDPLDPVMDRFERRVLDAMRALRPAVLRAAANALAGVRTDAAQDDVARALLRLGLQERLAGLVAEELEQAALQGSRGMFRELGHDQVLDYVDDTDIRRFETIGRELGDSVAERLATRVRAEVASGLQAGESTRDIRQRIEYLFDASQVDAARIARTEAIRGYANGRVAALRSVGITEFEFRALPGADEECQARHGHVYAIGDVENTPPVHPNCRCAPVAPRRTTA